MDCVFCRWLVSGAYWACVVSFFEVKHADGGTEECSGESVQLVALH